MDGLIVGAFLFSFTAMMLAGLSLLLTILDKYLGGE